MHKVALVVAFLGALTGTVAAHDWEGIFQGWPLPSKQSLGIAGTVLIAIAGYIGRQLLTPGRETKWARARVLAEALKREYWLYLMKVHPYDGANPHDALQTRTAEFLSNRGLERIPISEDSDTDAPSVSDIEGYCQKRALEQANWYEKSAGEHVKTANILKILTLGVGGITVALGVIGSVYTEWLIFLPVATTATAAIVAWTQANRASAVISLYQETATQLRFQVSNWRDGESGRENLQPDQVRKLETDLVEQCENIMARESEAWRAEWLSKEKAQKAGKGFEDVHETAAGGSDNSS